VAFSLFKEAQIDDDQGTPQPVPGMEVDLVRDDTFVVDTKTTNASGYVSFTLFAPGVAGDYKLDPQAKSPHYADPGVGANTAWDGLTDANSSENFTAAFSNVAPTANTFFAGGPYEENTGVKFVNVVWGDADSDNLTAVKDQGPAGTTIEKLSNTAGRWRIDTAVTPVGAHTIGHHVNDGWDDSPFRTSSLTITAAAANQAPTLDALPDYRLPIYTGTYEFQATATDPEDGTLTTGYDPFGAALAGYTVLDDGRYRFNTAVVPLGSNTYGMVVEDSEGAVDTDFATVEIAQVWWPFAVQGD
jgi:hypothetical protein